MNDPRDDMALLMAWRSGDDRAGRSLYERYADGVCRFFMSKLSNDDVAQDLAQRTFLACVEGRDRIRNDSSFRSYVFGVAHNLFREHLRRGSREPVDCSVTSAHDLGPTASALIGTVQQNRQLIEALRRLPLEVQIVHELRFWEGLTVPEIAVIVGTPEGTVKNRLRRGGQQLKIEIERIAAATRPLESTTTSLDGWAAGLRRMFGRSIAPARVKTGRVGR